eukprot:TRINITY_DN11927_c0_g3_i9.p1 TRINITY_DN11927_c0_g3~~TRINITY_DN11927_c0_g3_i9.p1  ORF type:complete len:510 (+),score=121.50 TRINITY_DN11927_c0_g3_i9:64-1593(+)
MFSKALVAFALLLAVASGKKILMQAMPFATSHHMVLSKIGRELVSRGHEVHFIRSSVDSDKVNTTGLHVHIVKLPMTKEHYGQHVLEISQMEDPLEGTKKILAEVRDICEVIALDDSLIKMMKTMDLALVDPAYMCSVFYAYAMHIPLRVDISPVNFYDPFMSGPYQIPQPWATAPQMGTKFTPDMNFQQRLWNSVVWLAQYDVRHNYIEGLIGPLNEKFETGMKLYDSFKDASIILFPTSFAFDFPRLLPPNAKMIGPILPESAKFPFAKDAELSTAVAKASKGVILVSFGTLARLPDDQAAALANVLTELKGYTVVWKYNGAKPKVGDNVVLRQWIPQNDVLGHTNTKLFISHGGANGILEAAYLGVPILGFPLFGDQWDNVARAVWRKMAIAVDVPSVTEDILRKHITTLLTDKSYSANAKAVSTLMRDQDRSPTQQAADWIDWSIKYNGGFHQRMPSYFRPWYVNQGWDVGMVWLSLLAVVMATIVALSCVCCCSKAKPSKAKTN